MANDFNILDASGPVIYTAGDFVPTTTGTMPNSHTLTGLAFDAASTESACFPALVPRSWPSVDIGVLGIAAAFGSGDVVLSYGDPAGADNVTVTVAGTYIGAVNFPTGPTWSAGSGPFADYQFTQFRFNRVGDEGGGLDTLAEDFAILAWIFTNGG